MGREKFEEYTRWVRDSPVPIFSVLVSRHGRLVYEMYTSSLGREEAHYMMSVTKSVVSALIGVAVDRQMIPGPEVSLTSLLPRRRFPDDAAFDRMQSLSLAQVMGMAALDAPDPVRQSNPETNARFQRFWAAPDRVAFALGLPRLQEPFQYNDSTPLLAVGALQQASGLSALDFGNETIFRALGFRHHEWMHQDAAGFDNGGYGLRLRPIDMQKFGILFLQHGLWQGEQVLSRAWVDRSFTPWNRSRPGLTQPDYGWFWWTYDYGPGWTVHVADGWKGQRIAVFPEQGIVFTMSACIEDGSEQEVFSAFVRKVLIPSVTKGAAASPPEKAGALDALLAEVRDSPARFGSVIEARMVPSVAPKEKKHRAFVAPPR